MNKRTIILAIIILIATYIIVSAPLNAIVNAEYNKNLINYQDSSEIVMEKNSKRILHEKNAHDKRFMASTTKILTAIVVIENCNLDQEVKITRDTTNIEGSSIYLEEGEILTVKELLYGLMLRSGNDCACTLAKHCSNTIENFAQLMNNTAKKIGANNSNFVNPHGLHNDNHYTTAYDLALITCYALQNNVFREIVQTKSITISNTKKDYKRVLINKNKMLKEFDGATGVKTGYTKNAGRCLVSSAIKDGMEIVSVVLNCGPMFERSKELLNNTFNSYKLVNLYSSNNVIDFIENVDCTEKIPIHAKTDLIIPLNKKELDNVKIVYEYPSRLTKIVKKDEFIGFIKIFSENNLLFQEKLYIMIDEKN